MSITRRTFVQYCIGSAAALGLDALVTGRLTDALAAGTGSLPAVIWLNGASCTGCTVSLANHFSSASRPTDVADLLINYIDLRFDTTLMGAAGDLAVQNLKQAASGSYILAIEGGIPTAFNGNTCVLWSEGGRDVTALEAVKMLAPRAGAILAIGTCASFGGVCGAAPNVTGVKTVASVAGRPTINIAGCPTHPDWIVWTIANLLAGVTPALDGSGRPKQLFGGYESNIVHKRCPRKGTGEVKNFGSYGCLKSLGCRGPQTYADCPTRKWNNGTSWCVDANAICLGCTEAGFPDRFSPLYRR